MHYTCFVQQRFSSDQERLGGGINEASGTITLSTGLGDNINLNLMADLSDDDEGHEVGLVQIYSVCVEVLELSLLGCQVGP